MTEIATLTLKIPRRVGVSFWIAGVLIRCGFRVDLDKLAAWATAQIRAEVK